MITSATCSKQIEIRVHCVVIMSQGYDGAGTFIKNATSALSAAALEIFNENVIFGRNVNFRYLRLAVVKLKPGYQNKINRTGLFVSTSLNKSRGKSRSKQ